MNVSDAVKELMRKAKQEMEKKRLYDYETMNRPKRKNYELPKDYFFKDTEEEIKEYLRSKK